MSRQPSHGAPPSGAAPRARAESAADPGPAALLRPIGFLVAAEVAVLSLWFSASAVLPALAAAHGLPVADLAGLATATQAGFVLGALALAASGLPDRLDPRRVFAAAAVLAASANLTLLVLPPDGWMAILSRLVVGAGLAGAYPVGLKIAVGWSLGRRAFVTSLLVGALTLGSAAPHLVVLAGGADWRVVLVATSALAALGAIPVLAIGLGPFHRPAARFDPRAIAIAWSDRGIRRAYLGYFGHMWELYAFWAWVGVVTAAAAARDGLEHGERWGALVAFLAIASGGLACIPAGWLADRHGKDRVARWALAGSLGAGLLAAMAWGQSFPLLVAALLLWGLTIVPDSPQFTAMVADRAPPEWVGSIMTLQTALGFLLTTLTVQTMPALAAAAGWPVALAALAIGPALGLVTLGRGS